MRKTQRWLVVQLEGLKRENQQLQQINFFSQNFIQSSRKQLEVMEENGKELKSLVPLLQRAASLIECANVARDGLSANFSHTEWFFHTFNNSFWQQESHAERISHSKYQHIQQFSTQSSRCSSDYTEYGDDGKPWLYDQVLASEELCQLTADIVTTFPTSSELSQREWAVLDHHQIPETGPRKTDTHVDPIATSSTSQSNDYDHLSDNGVHEETVDRTTEADKLKTHVLQKVRNTDHVMISEAPAKTVAAAIRGPTTPQGHICSESSPLKVWSTKPHSDTQPRKASNHSASATTGNSTKKGQQHQGVKHDDNELQSVLKRRREKVESQSEASKHTRSSQ